MSTALLSTKLQIPRMRATSVSRPRLTDRLVTGLEEGRRLTVVSAPAGYGKTTLLAEWLPLSGRRCGWLAVDEQDNEPVRFWTYLIAALQRAAPGLGESAMAAFQAPQPPAFDAVLVELINEITEGSHALLLVLDDYHLIASPPIHEAVSFLVENLPVQLHLALATRSDPPLPLPKLRAKGQLTEMRLVDLRFTPAEASAFLNRVLGLELSTEDLNRLETRTEGWIAGLQLAALSMRGREDLKGFIEAFSGSHRYVLDYLAEEVLNHQPEGVQEFLLQTSILQRLDGSLCDAVTGRVNGQEMLERLEEANLFLVPLDDERHWYRYHRLFADLLRTRLEDGDASAVAELHRRASRWYEQNGAIHDAVAHAHNAGDVQRLQQLIEMHGMPLLMRGELATLLMWISELPEDVLAGSPEIGTLHAWALLLTGQAQPLESRLRQVEQVLDRARSDDLGGQVAAIRAYQAAQLGDAAKTVSLAQSALEQLAEKNEEIRSVVLFVLGGAHLLSGNVAAAGTAMSEAGAMGRRAGNIHLAVPALNALAGIQLMQGQLKRSWQTAQDAVEVATLPSGQVLPIAGGALSSLAELAYERDEVEKALDYARQGITLGERWGNQDTVISGYLTLAQVLEGMGQFAGAGEAIEDAEQLARSTVTMPTMKAALRVAQGRLWLATDRRSAAQRWADETPDEPIHTMRVSELLTLARVRLTVGDVGSTVALLERLISLARAQALQAVLIEALALLALSHSAVRDELGALEALVEAVQLGEVEGFVRRFVDLGQSLVPLLRLVASRGVSVPYVRRLLAAFARSTGPTAEPAATQPLADPLSERELEVLGLIATGSSNQDIARKLFITVSTVKSHTNHIFGKLGAKSRTEAVARARDLGLL